MIELWLWGRRGIGIWVAIGLLFSLTDLKAEDISYTFETGDYRIVNTPVWQRIELDDPGQLAEPGKPLLPAKNIMIALPPGARVQSVDIRGLGFNQLPGSYQISPSPPVLPLMDPDIYPEYIEEINQKWRLSYDSAYSSDQAYPVARGKLIGSGALRKYAYASVLYYPFSYYPQSGRLEYYNRAEITVNYDLPIPGSIDAQKVEALKWDKSADQRATKLFVNYDQVKSFYHVDGSRSDEPLDNFDYAIITHESLLSAVNSSDFLGWKASLGYNVRVITTADPEIANQPGVDLAARIRNFLKNHYGIWGIKYVLLVGDYSTIPMRYCYPDPNNHSDGAGDPSNWPWAGDVPTDFYYADLSSEDNQSWDSDGDGFYGEYGQDDPDLLAEIYVGRIPTSIHHRITYTLNKLVMFEKDTGDWKNNVLHAGAIAYFENDDYSGRDLMDGAVLLDQMENEIMSAMPVSHYSEQDGLAPSALQWPGLSEVSFIGDWRNGQYGIVNWSAHGWSSYVARKVWSWDDGDGVPESHEMWWPSLIGITSNLSDNYPSIVFALSCLVGYPEPNAWGNLGIDLLTKPSYGAAVGIVSGTRVVWVSTGGGELHSYEFSHHLINRPYEPKKVGEALYDSKFYLSQNYYWNHYAEYWDMFTFNLYGDPAQDRNGVLVTGSDDLPPHVPDRFVLKQNNPNPFSATTVIRYVLPKTADVKIEVYDILGHRVETLIGERQSAGYHQMTWDAIAHSSGMYFYCIQAGEYIETQRIVLLR